MRRRAAFKTLPRIRRTRTLAETAALIEYIRERQRKLPRPPVADEFKAEWLRCHRSFLYFAETYVRIYDTRSRKWIPFDLWPEQRDTADTMVANRQVIILKARQLGLTWLVLAFALWLALFHPIVEILVYSLRDKEAIYLLTGRLKKMFVKLPEWMRESVSILTDDKHEWEFSNGSVIRALPTNKGDSYTVSLVIVDEADLVSNLDDLMERAGPTIEGGGRMILLSRSNKDAPSSPFKEMYRAAEEKKNDFVPVFLPWNVRPGRDEAWYARQVADYLTREGSLDGLHGNYPATVAEALAPRSKDKRIPPDWLTACYERTEPIALETVAGAPALPNLVLFRPPEPGRRYVVGSDPAEGNPTSNDSATVILDRETGEQVAELVGKLEPGVFADYTNQLASYYNAADLMVLRNNHGHAVLLWLSEHGTCKVLKGPDDRPGYAENKRTRAMLWDDAAGAFRTKDTVVRSLRAFTQLSMIRGDTLKAPDSELDDVADAYATALYGRSVEPPKRPKHMGGGE